MKAKLPLIICFFYSVTAFSQSQFLTNGLFSYVDTLKIPNTYEIGPGQLTKSGDHFILGLLDGELEDYVNLMSDIYAIDLNPTANDKKIQPFNLPNAPDSVRYFQCSASNKEEVVVYVSNLFAGWNDNDLAIAVKQADGSYRKTRMLTELNDPLESDAYPWLSPDGLHIYYNRNFKILYAERNSIQDSFSAPVEIKFDGQVNLEIVSSWLSEDEKNMFIIANNRIYYASRKSTSEPFSFPALFTDEFKSFYFISGLSFAPDRKTMVLYYSTEDKQTIVRYQLKKGKAW